MPGKDAISGKGEIMDMDLFSMFGFQEETVKEKPKKEHKGKDVKPQKKTTDEKDKFVCPLSVITDLGDVKITEDDEKTEEQVVDFVAKQLSLPADKCVLQKKGKKILFSINRESVAAKGVVEISPDSNVYVGKGQKIDVSGLLDSDKPESVSFEKLGSYLAENVSVLYSRVTAFSSADKEVHVVPGMISQQEMAAELSKMTFPFCIGTVDSSVRKIEEDYYETFLKENGKQIGGKKTELLYEDMKHFVDTEFPQFHGEAVFNVSSDKNAVLVFVNANPKKKPKTSADKDLIPTEGTSISLIFTKIDVSPEMFGGKKAVKKSEIIKVLGEMYPEYSASRTMIEYDEQNKIIIPILKGAKKGCDIPGFNPELPFEKWEQWKNGYEYHLFQTKKGNVLYQAEITPISSVLVPVQISDSGEHEGEFLWKIEKIPVTFILAVAKFFEWIYRKKGTEVLVHLWYHPEKGYKLTLPEQEVMADSVSAEMTDDLSADSFVLVADIHSHGRYPAFFSATDDADEKGNRLYGVFGGFDGDAKSRTTIFRTGSRGYFLPVRLIDVMSDCFRQGQADIILDDLKKRAKVCLTEG